MKQRILYILFFLAFSHSLKAGTIDWSGAISTFVYNGLEQSPIATTPGCSNIGVTINYYYQGRNTTVYPLVMNVPPTNVGDYSVYVQIVNGTCSGLTSIATPFNFTITPASLTITANNANKIYGLTQNTPVTGSTSFTPLGLQNGEMIGTVTLNIGPGAILQPNPVGSTSVITPSAAIGGTFNPSNYTIVYVSGTLSVTSATLTITAVNKTKVYGSVNPTLTYSYAGLVNGDVAPSTLPTTNTTAVTGSPVGSYTITLSGASDPNYTIGYVSGTLSVTSATLTITAV
ncbi:MAG: MBG domain-containing protein, partial [Chitinophagia bacterium]